MAPRFSRSPSSPGRLLIPLEALCLICLIVALALHRRHRHTTGASPANGGDLARHRWSQSYPGGTTIDNTGQGVRTSLRGLGTVLGAFEAVSFVSEGGEGRSFEMAHDWVRAPGVFLVMEDGDSWAGCDGALAYDEEEWPDLRVTPIAGTGFAARVSSLVPGVPSVGARVSSPVATSSDNPSRPWPTGAYALRGRVVEFATGAPVAAASVAFVWKGQRSAGLTDASGMFELRGVEPGFAGRLLVRADATLYAEDTRDLTLAADPLLPSGKATVVMTIAPIRLVRLDSRPASARAGVGLAAVNRSGRAVVAYVVPGSPAALAAVRAGDLLIAVDGRDTGDLGTAALGVLLRGEPSSDIELTVAPAGGGDARTVHLRRAA